MGGSQRARRGLAKVMGKPVDSRKKQGGAEACRCLLFRTGVEVKDARNENVVRRAVTAAEARVVLKKKGKLPVGELGRLRVRYFSEGLVLGGKEFVEAVFEETGGATARGARRARGPSRKWRAADGMRCGGCGVARTDDEELEAKPLAAVKQH